MGKPITVYDIAEHLGVSPSLVAKALRGDPRVSETRREDIRAAAGKLGYRPNPAAVALLAYRWGNRRREVKAALGWLCHDNNGNGGSVPWGEQECWAGAYRRAEALGYRLEKFTFGGKISAKRQEKILRARGIRGVLVAPCMSPEWGNFGWTDFAGVRVGRVPAVPGFHAVVPDHLANVRLALGKMRERGYRKIFVVPGRNPEIARYLHAAIGWEESEGKDGVAWFAREPSGALDERTFLHRFRKEKPDAILSDEPVVSDLLQKAGYRIPGDVALANFDALTVGGAGAGIDRNWAEIGASATTALALLLNANCHGIPRLAHKLLVSGLWIDGPTLPTRCE
jgi:LacI family transcriptional regulator